MRILVLIIILLGFTAPSYAMEGAMHRLQSPAVQKQTAQAVRLAEQGKWAEARTAIAESHDPLAAKLYHWLTYTRQDRPFNYIRLTQFIRQNPEWPGISTLVRKAEDVMPQTLDPREVRAWFEDYRPRTAKGLDRYVSALLEMGDKDKAREVLGEWWADTPLSRDDQIRLFRKYNRYLNTAAHMKRLDMLLYRGQEENALAIADVLGADYVALARARIALSKDRNNVNALIAAVPKKLQNDAGLLYERLRWRRKNDLNDGMIQILDIQHKVKDIQNPASWWLERHILIRRLIENKDFDTAYRLAAAHGQKSGLPFAQGEWLSGWLALRFLKDPVKALEHFQVLYAGVSTPISKARAEYWAGRAASALGQKPIMLSWYEKASNKQTTFYGQMAAAELKVMGTFTEIAPPTLTAQQKQNFEAAELVQAARIFHMAGARKTASAFIQAFAAHEKTAEAYIFAIQLSALMKHYHDVVRIAKKATQEGLFLTAQAYPVITEYLGGIVGLEWALIHALIRQESMFDIEAKSPVGALGLMQLMPATAVETARKLGIQHRQYWLTSKPDHNIRLGTEYLRRMIERYKGAYPLAIAAYNAGPGRVDRWVETYGDPRKGEVDIIDWIEMIPIYETRNYVQRVVEATYVYRLRLKGQQRDVTIPVSLATPQNLKSF